MTDSFDDEVKIHFEKFIKSFIEKDKTVRWQYLLIEKPEKADHRELMKFYGHRNKLTTKYIKHLEFPKLLGKNYESIKGIYFDDYDKKAEGILLSDAINKGYGREAIFSIRAGELALFFTHEHEAFICQK